MATPLGTTTLKSVSIKAGECVVLPAGAEVIAVTTSGSITATSSCGTLPTPGSFKCWRFKWGEGTFESDGFGDCYFTGIQIGDTLYDLVGAPVAEANTWDNGADFLAQAIPVATPPGLVDSVTSSGGEAVHPKCLIINIPEELGQPILFWSNPGFEYGAYYGEEDQCSC